ncbi:stage II sporulation protein R [Halalkalibacterium ligniniphilum]|uniref:stage II sporulation protein R n=1 Tax=Halalkalibacterium ligniniphilum TaxID=1134413 RepID=UPI00034A2237|nr:stage II sporulation protein R [Halalkalibacterium ligniniphilum]
MNQKVLIYLLFSLFVIVLNWEAQHTMAVASLHQQVSEEEALRLRILANSDSVKDQIVKRDIRDAVNVAITEWVTDISDLEEAKQTIQANLANIESIVEGELAKAGLEQTFTVAFDEVQFPTKLYGDLVYPAGMYDAVLITLGDGSGENWWCVLFPPLCFLDMANGDAVEAEKGEDEEEQKDKGKQEQEVDVSFFVVELFSNLVERFSK